MRRRFWVIILLQVLLLASIVGYRAWWVATGERIVLPASPVDPRDLLRGEYVRLAYDISNLDLDRLDGDDAYTRNDAVFVVLRKRSDGLFMPVSVHDDPPLQRPFVQGRVIDQASDNRWELVVKDDAGRRHVLEPRGFGGKEGDRFHFCLDGRGTVVSFGNRSSCAPPWRHLAGIVEKVDEIRFNRLRVEYGIESYFVEEGEGRRIEAARSSGDLAVEVALQRNGHATITRLQVNGMPVR